MMLGLSLAALARQKKRACSGLEPTTAESAQLFQEAKKEKIIQDLTKYNPPGFLDQLNDGSEDASA